MFSSNAFETNKLIENILIAGLNQENLESNIVFKLDIINRHPNSSLIPDFLFSFPENKEQLTNTVLDVSFTIIQIIFPSGYDVSYTEEVPKFTATVRTNAKAIRSYFYTLKFYEKVEIFEKQIDRKENKLNEEGENTCLLQNKYNLTDSNSTFE